METNIVLDEKEALIERLQEEIKKLQNELFSLKHSNAGLRGRITILLKERDDCLDEINRLSVIEQCRVAQENERQRNKSPLNTLKRFFGFS